MATNRLIHYALDLESPPLIACGAPDATGSSLDPTKVTCPDCMTHEEFPRIAAALPRITAKDVLMEAAALLSDGDNPEYDRAILELTQNLIGDPSDDGILMTRILRALKEGN